MCYINGTEILQCFIMYICKLTAMFKESYNENLLQTFYYACVTTVYLSIIYLSMHSLIFDPSCILIHFEVNFKGQYISQ